MSNDKHEELDVIGLICADQAWKNTNHLPRATQHRCYVRAYLLGSEAASQADERSPGFRWVAIEEIAAEAVEIETEGGL